MSYDYNDLVTKIMKSRKQYASLLVSSSDVSSKTTETTTTTTTMMMMMLEHLQHSVDTFATLSSYCPMTPLLWMQYSFDTATLLQLLSSVQQNQQQEGEQGGNDDGGVLISSLTTQLQLLELGLAEFPGSALLHLYFLNTLMKLYKFLCEKKRESNNDTKMNTDDDDDDGDNDDDDDINTIIETTKIKMRSSIDNAIECVGKGSHRNESQFVVAIYRIDAIFRLLSGSDWDTIINKTFIERAKIPMKDVNDTIKNEYIEFCAGENKTPDTTHLSSIEDARRYEAKTYPSKLISLEDDIDIAMNNENILPPKNLMVSINDDSNNIETFNWEKIILQQPSNDDNEETTSACYWMGYGGIESSNAFQKYAQACYRYRIQRKEQKHDDDNETNNDKTSIEQESNQEGEEEEEEERIVAAEITIKDLALNVYERGVTECPTVESIWLSYIQHLQYLLQQSNNDNNNQTEISSKLLNVVDRGMRNCPYSHQLVQQKLKSQLLLADIGLVILDPDELIKTIQDALETKFIPTPHACLQLYMTAIEVIRRRILSVLALVAAGGGGGNTVTNGKYDDTEPFLPTTRTAATKTGGIYTEIDDNKKEELQDLCEDLRELYDTSDTYLRKQHSAWSEGRLKLWSDRSLTESMMLTPLLIELSSNNVEATGIISGASTAAATANMTDDVVNCYEKIIKVHQPCHPDTYAMYIKNFTTSNLATKILAGGQSIHWILARLRQTRFLYQKAIKLVGKPKKVTPPPTAETSTTTDDIMLLELQQQRDYETSLQSLCRDYLLFEKTFGSDRSIANAFKNIQKKLSKNIISTTKNNNSKERINGHQGKQNNSALTAGNNNKTTPSPTMKGNHQKSKPNYEKDGAGNTKKRSREDLGVEPTTDTPATKKQKAIDHPMSIEKPDAIVTGNGTDKDVGGNGNGSSPTASLPTGVVHKVKVGNLEYPAHPLTVRISKLHTKTQDMDIVDALKPKCGAIVHARIMRERHQHQHQHQQGDHGGGGRGKSKGWALVQFEDRDSVEKALELSGIIGIHEKLIVIERSHMPAVALVPPGMHRVNPKGEGKKSKFNQKRKEKIAAGGKNKERTPPPQRNTADKDNSSSTPSNNMSILAFQPRGVQHSQKHRKVKVDIPKKDS